MQKKWVTVRDLIKHQLIKLQRRRRQIRLAQRAYRSRNIANTQALRHHLAHLQAGIQDISDAAILFSDLIMQSGVLTTHPEITGPLREMLHKCMGLAKGVEAGCNQEDTHSDAAGASQPFPPDSSPLENTQPSVGEVMCPSLSIESFQALAGGKYRLQFPSSWPEVGTSNSGEVEMSSFTQYLRVACLYNALALLKDTSATIEDLRRPLRLLLSLATRETIISIFEASLKARLRGQEPEKFQELSVFQQDGTESHCKRNSSQSQIQRSHRTDCTVERPPFHSYSKDQDGEGRWFDIQDLEEHLREKNVSLCLFAPSGPNVNSSPCIINTLTLIAGKSQPPSYFG
jgi:hypothetical protein